MDESEAAVRSDRLVANVERALELLRSAGDLEWEPWLAAVHRELVAGDGHGLDRLLRGFGAMGSFNDLVLTPLNRHTVAPEDVSPVNEELSRLRSEMYDDATELRRDLRGARPGKPGRRCRWGRAGWRHE